MILFCQKLKHIDKRVELLFSRFAALLQDTFRIDSWSWLCIAGNKVVVPSKGSIQVLELLHEAHPGIGSMKHLAQEYVWWPRIDNDIECRVKL